MLVGIQVVGIPSIVIAYAVDCYKTLPGEIMIAATIVKNTFGVSTNTIIVSLPTAPWHQANHLLIPTVWHDLLHQRLGSQGRLPGPDSDAHGPHRRFLRARTRRFPAFWQEVPPHDQGLQAPLSVMGDPRLYLLPCDEISNKIVYFGNTFALGQDTALEL